MLACGIEGFLITTSLSRSIVIGMRPYDEKTKPQRKYDSNDVADLNDIYRYIHHFFARAKLLRDPKMPPGLIRRLADNWRPLIAVADACSPAWGKLARATALVFMRREKEVQPEVLITRHGLLIFDISGVDAIKSVDFNKALHRLDVPDAKWHASYGAERAHPLTLSEQAALLELSGIRSHTVWPTGRGSKKSIRGYTGAEFEAAARKWDLDSAPTEGSDRKQLLLTPKMVADE
jgi:hypothetical protein